MSIAEIVRRMRRSRSPGRNRRRNPPAGPQRPLKKYGCFPPREMVNWSYSFYRASKQRIHYGLLAVYYMAWVLEKTYVTHC